MREEWQTRYRSHKSLHSADEAVAVPTHRDDVSGAGGILLYVAAQAHDEAVHHARSRVRPQPPDRFQELPARHGEGKFVTESREILERLEAGHLIVARYLDAEGKPTEEWPANPNGSPGAIAGVCDPSGRLFGMMPHPDAYLYPFQHPLWTRRRLAGDVPDEGAGLAIFRNGVDAAADLF